MAKVSGDLIGGLLQGYMQASQQKKDRMEREEMKKLQIKMFKDDLERKEKEEFALGQVINQMSGIQGLDYNEMGPPAPTQKMSLLDMLADPKGQALLMKAGMRPQEIIASTKQSTPFDLSSMPEGMKLKGIKITDKGLPMYDFEMPEADKEIKDPTGRNVITLDKQGNPLSTRPAAPEELSLTPAQKAIDTKFAEEYTQFTTAGGFTDVQKGVGQLNEALSALQKSSALSGPVIGGTSDTVLKFTNPDAIAVREQVEEVVQKNLKLILGSQYTEKEGTALIARAYNPNLDEAENAKRLTRLITQIQGAAQAKMEAIKYYEENGTLAGFKGKIPSMTDFDPETVTLTPENEALVNKYLPKK